VKLPFFQINAFTRDISGGNPAGVCILEPGAWPPIEQMQRCAAGSLFAEIAFLKPGRERWHIRWFGPRAEVDLCGHATLAAAHVLRQSDVAAPFTLEYPDGEIEVTAEGDAITIALPTREPAATRVPDALIEGLGAEPTEVLRASDYLGVFRTEGIVRNLAPNFRRLDQLRGRGVIATAPGEDVDFVSRFFAPALGIDEDHVTGSAHCTLAPYWAERLGKPRLTALQVSPRGGELECQLQGERVLLTGQGVTYFEGEVSF
jgi:predicted PhzF superfamily epimerase YddE/YHI9